MGPASQKSTQQVNKSFQTFEKSTDKLQKALKDAGDPKVFNDLDKAIKKSQDEIATTGKVSEKTMKELKVAVESGQKSFDSLSDEAKKDFSVIEQAIDDVNKDLKVFGKENALENLSSDAQNSEKNLKELEKAVDNTDQNVKGLGKESGLNDLSRDLDKTEDNLQDVEKELKDVEKEVKDVDRSIDDMGDTAIQETENVEEGFNGLVGTLKKVVGAIAVVFAVDKIKDFFLTVVETTADLEAVNDQYTQVMGNMKNDTDKYLNEMSETWNKHPNELKNSYMQYVALLKGKGVEEKLAHETAQKYMDLTVDGNAFANESMEDTTARFAAMIKGEYSSVDTAMVNLTATQLDALAKSTLGKKFAELTTAEQELLKTNEALRQQDIAGVIGQGAREADSYNNNVAMLKSTWDEFLADYGGPAMNLANEGLKKGIQFVRGLGGNIDSARKKIEPFIER
ncbi:MAG: hypothetical protein ABS920_14385, partial [Sporosarcina sp.]